MKNVLAVGAHPDDVEFGCAGTLARHVANGDQVTIMHMTCSDCLDIYGETITQADIRRKEAEKAAKIIGTDLVILDFIDQQLPFDREAIFAIERELVKRKINIVYTHWNGDSHQDHINAMKSVLAAARHIDEIFLYEQVPLPRVGKIFSEVNYYVDISEYYEIKEQSAMAHSSQVKGKYNDKIILGMKSLAEFRGGQCDCEYAEAFEAVKQIIR